MIDLSRRSTVLLAALGFGFVFTPSAHADWGENWGQMIWSGTAVAAPEGRQPVSATILRPNIPNPFNPRTVLRYEIAEATSVSLVIYSIAGRVVRTLEQHAPRDPGQYQVVWNGRDDAGLQVSSGVYLYAIKAGPYSAAKRMVLLR